MAKQDPDKLISSQAKEIASLKAQLRQKQASINDELDYQFDVAKAITDAHQRQNQALDAQKEATIFIKIINEDIAAIEKQLIDNSQTLSKAQKRKLMLDRQALKNAKQENKVAVAIAKKQREIGKLEAAAIPHKKKLLEAQQALNKSQETYKDAVEESLGFVDKIKEGIKTIPGIGGIAATLFPEDKIKEALTDKYSKKLAGKLNPAAEKQRKISEATVNAYEEQINRLKGVESASGDITAATQETAAGMSEVSGGLTSASTGAGELSGGLASASTGAGNLLMKIGGIGLGVGALIAGIVMLVKKINDVRDAAIDISREQSLTKDEAYAQMASMKQMQLDATKYGTALGTATEEMQKADEFFKSTFETGNKLSDVNAQMSAYLQKNFAATAEDANGFLTATALTGQQMDKNVVMLDDMRIAFNKATGASLRMKDLVKSISSLSETTLANLKNIPEAIYKGVMYLKQFGLTFEDTKKTADSLLDIESSINAEFEASVLTGKHINLNRARELALMGKEVPMMEEIVSQLGTYDELMNMLPMQREKIAASVGMEADKMLAVAKRLQLVNALGETRVKQLDRLGDEELQKAAAGAKSMDQEAAAAILAERASIKASELTASTMGKMTIWVDKQLAGDTEAEKAYKEAGYTNTFDEKPVQTSPGGNETTMSGEPIRTNDTLIRPGQPPIKFAEGDIVLAGTNLFGEQSSTTSSNSSNGARLESLLEKLIAAVNQPVQIVMGGKVIDELDTRTTLRKTYNTSVDQGYGVFG